MFGGKDKPTHTLVQAFQTLSVGELKQLASGSEGLLMTACTSDIKTKDSEPGKNAVYHLERIRKAVALFPDKNEDATRKFLSKVVHSLFKIVYNDFERGQSKEELAKLDSESQEKVKLRGLTAAEVAPIVKKLKIIDERIERFQQKIALVKPDHKRK